jgi:hypothetical protein
LKAKCLSPIHVFDIVNNVLKKKKKKSKRNMLLRHTRFPCLYLLKMLWLHNSEKSVKSYLRTSSSSQILEFYDNKTSKVHMTIKITFL